MHMVAWYLQYQTNVMY